MEQIYLYGIAGTEDSYRVVRYERIDDARGVKDIMNEAFFMGVRYPTIEHVYAIDNRHGLRRDYMNTIKHYSIENCLIFKDILEREGLKIF